MSEFIETGLECPDTEGCGSSDAAAINSDGWTSCFSCGNRWGPTTSKQEGDKPMKKTESKLLSDRMLTKLRKGLDSPVGLSARGLTSATMKKFGVYTDNTTTYFPLHEEGVTEPVGCQCRIAPKDLKMYGDTAVQLFGQDKFPAGGKFIVITEGFIDAMSVYQMQGSRYPVVSIRGTSSAKKDVQRNYEWLDKFEHIIVACDNDDAGAKAAKDIAALFGGKSKIAHFSGYNDPNDMLLDGASGEAAWKTAFWQAETYTPDGIVAASSLWEEVNQPAQLPVALYPWDGMNEITHGIRDAELVTICSGSGMGKSQVVRELSSWLLETTEDNIGMMMLEESKKKTALGFMSHWMRKLLHLPKTKTTEEERKKAFEATLGTERLFLFDHFGSTSVENIMARARYMNKALGCQYLFLDHLSIIVSAQDNGDERKAIDEIMTKLRMMVQNTGMCLFLVSHLKRPDGKGHEEGGTTSLSQLRGSASIAQLSDIVIGLERNGQADCPLERNTTVLRILKNRFSGETGRACNLLFDGTTGRMEEVDPITEAEAAL